MLDGVEPMPVGAGVFQQPVARAQRALQRIDAAAVLGIDRQHEPVEEAAALGGRAIEQPIHGRDEPDDAQVIGESRRRRDRLAVDAALAGDRRVLGGGRLDPGAEARQAERAVDISRHRP